MLYHVFQITFSKLMVVEVVLIYFQSCLFPTSYWRSCVYRWRVHSQCCPDWFLCSYRQKLCYCKFKV